MQPGLAVRKNKIYRYGRADSAIALSFRRALSILGSRAFCVFLVPRFRCAPLFYSSPEEARGVSRFYAPSEESMIFPRFYAPADEARIGNPPPPDYA